MDQRRADNFTLFPPPEPPTSTLAFLTKYALYSPFVPNQCALLLFIFIVNLVNAFFGP